MTSVQPKRSLFSASPTERKGCLLLAVASKKKADIKECTVGQRFAHACRTGLQSYRTEVGSSVCDEERRF